MQDQLVTILVAIGSATIALAGLILVQTRALRQDMKGLRSEVASLRDRIGQIEASLGERVARIEGRLDELREFFFRTGGTAA